MDLQVAIWAASEATVRIDAKVKNTLMKRARRQGMIDAREVTELVDAWKRAARHTKRLHRERGRQKGH
jgi:hypothetical protein